jgi:Stage II sporulation protein E (SpoIIE)/Phosphoserine phosphatase RsbU, N-terminal domain
VKLMAGPANKRSARGVGTPRKRFERRYQSALERHFRSPTEGGLEEAHDLGRQALSEGVDILDVVGIHMEARRGLFPEVGSKFTEIDAFLRASLAAFQHVREELETAQRHVDADRRRIETLRTLRDVAAELARATTRRAVATVMLRTTMELSGGGFGAVVLFRSRASGRDRRPDLLATMPSRDASRVRALGAAAHALDGLLEAHASLDLSTPAEVRSAIGDEPADALAADTLVAYPLVWRDAVRGALVVTAAAGAFDHIDRELLDAIVVMGVPALERAGRYDIDHEIALKLQRGMLSIPACDPPELRWSARYSSAATGLVGGDWYDVIDLDDRVGLAIGDIVGRGIDAAVMMGQMRSAGRALANCFDKPHEVIEGLDHFSSATGCGEDSSMAYVTINRKSGEVSYSVAGHPPPLVLLPDGTAGWLDQASSSLLGRGGSRPTSSLMVDPGTTIVLYTDGLVERRGEPFDAGLARLVTAARATSGEDDPARQLVEHISSERTLDDDVAVVVVRFLGS